MSGAEPSPAARSLDEPPPVGRPGLEAPGGLQRHLVAAMMVAALTPLVSFGVFALVQVDAAVQSSLDRQVRVALDAAVGLLERDRADLAETTASYATWPVLREAVADRQLEGLRRDVVDFLVGSGEIDVAVVASTSALVGGGDDDALAAVAAIAGRAAAASPAASDVGPRMVGLAAGIYQVAAFPVVDAARTIGAVAMARRVDALTLVAIARTTGFEVAAHGPAGAEPVVTDAALLGSIGGEPPVDGVEVAIADGLAVGRRALLDDSGATVVGTIVVAKTLDALDNVATNLVAFVGWTLLAAVAGSVALAWALGLQLRSRAAAVAGWVAALESGTPPPPGRAVDLDLRTVSEAMADLAETLRRREQRLQASLDEISRLGPRLGSRAVTEAGLRAARRVFDAEEVALARTPVAGDVAPRWDPEVEGLVRACSSATADRDDPRPTVSAPLDIETGVAIGAGQTVLLVARGARLAGWTEPDRAVYALFARLLGIAIRDAIVVDRAGDRVRQADRLAALQADFLRGVSHNLQQPLTTIRLVADDLASAPDLDRVRAAAIVIRAESVALTRLVGQLLTMSRLEAGTMRIDAEPIAPGALVRTVWSSLRSARRLAVDDRAPGVLAIADRACVEQILAILLDNAVRYAPRGAITVRIEPRREGALAGVAAAPVVEPHEAGTVSITVIDSGPGIPEDERDRVFERFARGSTSAGIAGTGLGLDVARGLARAMGGSVAYRDLGSGAAFELVLPAEPDLGPA